MEQKLSFEELSGKGSKLFQATGQKVQSLGQSMGFSMVGKRVIQVLRAPKFLWDFFTYLATSYSVWRILERSVARWTINYLQTWREWKSTSIKKLPDAVELLWHTRYIKRSSQVRNVLVNIDAPGYQNVETFMVPCQHEKRQLHFLLTFSLELVPRLVFSTEV